MAIWLLLFGAMAILVRAGLATVTAGVVRPADVVDALLAAAADVAAAALAFWAVGACFLFGRNGDLIAFDPNLILSQAIDSAGTEFFHTVVAIIGGAVVTGALVGRAKPYVAPAASAVLAGVVFPIIGHLVWFGRLRHYNVVDFGGAASVHLPAAVFAAVAAAMVGNRPSTGRTPEEPTAASVGRSVPLVAVGVVLLAVGWMPYLMGSLLAHPTEFNPSDTPSAVGPALAVTAMNTVLAGLAGMVTGMAYGRVRHGRADLFAAYLGLLGGLVAITPGCVAVGNAGAVMIGVVAGVAVPAAAGVLNRVVGLGDPVGLVAAHGVGAVWGVLATAVFAAGQSTIRHVQLVGLQALLLVVALVISAVAAAATFGLLRAVGPLQADAVRGVGR